METSKALGRLAIIVIALPIIAFLIWYVLGERAHWILSSGILAASLSTFFGLLIILDVSSPVSNAPFPKNSVRTAIAAAVVVAFIGFVCFYTFVPYQGELASIQQQLLESFTTIVGVTIAFYFGAEAVAAGATAFSRSRGEEENQES